MATLTIRAVDDDLKARLRLQAAANGHSMEAEVRRILRLALTAEPSRSLGSALRARFADLDGVDLEQPDRAEPARAAELPV